MWPAQDDVKAVRAEARERAEAADRLKIKYDYMIKSLGGGGEGKEDKKSEEGKEKASNLSARYSEQIKLNIGCVIALRLTSCPTFAGGLARVPPGVPGAGEGGDAGQDRRAAQAVGRRGDGARGAAQRRRPHEELQRHVQGWLEQKDFRLFNFKLQNQEDEYSRNLWTSILSICLQDQGVQRESIREWRKRQRNASTERPGRKAFIIFDGVSSRIYL